MVTKVAPNDLLIEELFKYAQEANIETNNHTSRVAKRIVDHFIKKLSDPKNQTFIYLSSTDGIECWDNATYDDKAQYLNASASNDACESTFGVLPNELKTFDNIG